MNRLPYFRFYPGDWRKDLTIQSTSLAARGLWVELLCFLCESPQPGHLVRDDGTPIDGPELARLCGCTTTETQELLKELEQAGTFTRSKKGAIVCAWLVAQDRERKDWRRRQQGHRHPQTDPKQDTQNPGHVNVTSMSRPSSSSSSSSYYMKNPVSRPFLYKKGEKRKQTSLYPGQPCLSEMMRQERELEARRREKDTKDLENPNQGGIT